MRTLDIRYCTEAYTKYKQLLFPLIGIIELNMGLSGGWGYGGGAGVVQN